MTGSENNACSEFRGGDYANGLDAGTSAAQSDNPNFENKNKPDCLMLVLA